MDTVYSAAYHVRISSASSCEVDNVVVSCLLTVTLHIVDVRLTCLINITYLLTYLLTYLHDSGVSSGQLDRLARLLR